MGRRAEWGGGGGGQSSWYSPSNSSLCSNPLDGACWSMTAASSPGMFPLYTLLALIRWGSFILISSNLLAQPDEKELSG